MQADHHVARRAGLLLRTNAWNGESAPHLHERTRDLCQATRTMNVTQTHARVKRIQRVPSKLSEAVSEVVDVPRWPL